MYRKSLWAGTTLALFATAFGTGAARAGSTEPVWQAYIFPGVGTLLEILLSLLR